MTEILGGWLIRSAVLILAGALLLRLLRVKNPSVLLTAWTVALAGSLTIPLLTAALPRVPVAGWHMPAGRTAAVPAAASGEASRPAPPAARGPVPAAAASQPFDWTRFGLAVYGFAAAALLFRLFTGLALSLRLLRRSRPAGIASGGREARESDEVATPVTIGILRPAMLLPGDWRSWNPAKLEAVLAHEQSHIRRRDPAVQFLSAIHRALLWASPASWFLHSRLVRAAEAISDDDAIAASSDRVGYAEILLEFVQRGAGATRWAGVPMARYDRPEKRIRRILDGTAVAGGATRRSIAAVLAMGAPIAYLAAATHPQAAPGPKQLPEFEVARIQPVDPNVMHEMGVHVYPGGRVVIAAFPLKSLVATAFGLAYWQVSSGEEWTEKTEYTIEAAPPEAMRSRIQDLRYTLFGIEDARLREMLQALLIDRFQLKFHRETKTGEVYVMQRNGKPPALRPMEISGAASGAPPPDQGAFGSIGYAGGQWGIFATSMPQLAQFASSFILHVPVLDQTGVSGRFDYRQRWPDLEPRYSGDQSGSFRNFLQEAGLKLERAKGPVEALVIDHAARPSPN